LATLKDVAAKAGVHPSTVSRVLRGSENIPISEATRKKIQLVAEELKYQPDQRARALRLGKSNAIGLILPDIANSFFAEIAKSIEQQSYAAGYTLVVCDTNENQEKEIHFVNNLISRGIDGLIIAPVQDSHDHLITLKEKKYPLVLIDRCFENFETNAVVSDNEEAAFNAVAHLAKLGHKRVAFLFGRRNIYTIKKRYDGYKRAVDKFNLSSEPSLVSGSGFTFDSGFASTLSLLTAGEMPTAILVSGNIITLGAFKAILSKGLKIPTDISMIGFTDNVISPFLPCPLTTVSHPLEEMGLKAFGLLKEHIDSNGFLPYSKIIVKTIFHERQSTERLHSINMDKVIA
jgi:LacI family transcriptional regulator